MDTLNSKLENNLNELDTNLDINDAPPIHQKRLVTIFNHFVISMVDFMNNFNQSCITRLFKFDQKICKVEAELRLLEKKLGSIPELEDKKDVDVVLPSPLELEVQTESDDKLIEPSVEDKNGEISQEGEPKPEEVNPEVQKYVKMISFGVPIDAVKIKMKLEGVDPNLLKM